MNPEADPTSAGVLVGGWTYIWAAYFVTWGTFAGYALSLFLRERLFKGSDQ